MDSFIILQDDVYIAGNVFECSGEINRSSTRIQNGWAFDIDYIEDTFGYHCPQHVNGSSMEKALGTGEDFKFRVFLRRDGTEFEMKGLDYKIQFPLSETSTAFDVKPTYQVHPFFFATVGKVETITITSSDPDIGMRRVAVYMPPSITENPQPEYDVMIAIDISPELAEYVKPLLDFEFAEMGGLGAKELVLVGYGDYFDDMHDRTNLLVPVN